MPTTDIQMMCILECNFKFGADEGVSAWNILLFSRYQSIFNFCSIGLQTHDQERLSPYHTILGRSSLILLLQSFLRSITCSQRGRNNSSSSNRETGYVSSYPKKSEYPLLLNWILDYSFSLIVHQLFFFLPIESQTCWF